MPTLVLNTNVKVDNVKTFVLDFSKIAAEVLNKPEKYISIQYNYHETLSFGGTFDPAYTMVITSLDNINPKVNDHYSATFHKYLSEELHVRGDRYYIVFNDPGRAFIGHEGTTFATIFGK